MMRIPRFSVKSNVSVFTVGVALALSALNVGCSPGKVAVNGGSAGSDPSSPGSADSASRNGAHGDAGGNPNPSTGTGSGNTPDGGAGAARIKIFFERVLVERLPQSVIAVSYLPQGAHGAAPFGAPLRVPQEFGPNPIFVPGTDHVVYLRSTGIGSDSLVVTSLSNMRTLPLFAFPRPIASFALDGTGTALVWAGRDGAVSIVNLNDATLSVRLVAPANLRARNVLWNSTGTRLLVRTDADAYVFTVPNATAPSSQIAAFRDVAAAAFSPEGDRVAIVGRSDRGLRVRDLASRASSADFTITTLESSDLYDFSWNAKHGLTYWVRLRSGQQEIRIVPATKTVTDTASERTWVRLSVPSGIRGGVVCPNWSADGSMLYFSDYIDGEYVIERLASDANASPTIFAQPPASDEGFVCPRSE